MAQAKAKSPALAIVQGNETPDAKRRLIDAGITIFGIRGLSAPTVRDVTEAAGCNIAAVNYHFGSRDNFLKTVLQEVFAPIRKHRDDNLALIKQRYPDAPIPVLELVEAWVLPLIDAQRDADGGRIIVRFMQQLWAEPAGSAMKFVVGSFDYGANSYIDAFAQSLPALARSEVVWRFEMMRGAALHAMANCDPLSRTLDKLSGGEPTIDVELSTAVLSQIVQFCAAGFIMPPAWSAAELLEGRPSAGQRGRAGKADKSQTENDPGDRNEVDQGSGGES